LQRGTENYTLKNIGRKTAKIEYNIMDIELFEVIYPLMDDIVTFIYFIFLEKLCKMKAY